MKNFKIFVIDDEEIIRVSLSDELEDYGYKVYSYESPSVALNDFKKYYPDIVFTDIKMPEINGIDLLKEIKKIAPSTIVVVMTAYASIDSAVTAIKLGAFDYLNKPFDYENLDILLKQINNFLELRNEKETIVQQFAQDYTFDKLIGKSQASNFIVEQIRQVAPSDLSVLITGETGTGKELVANILHYNSFRNDKPFIKLSCATLARDIFESELFGHEKGAFTGAIKSKRGRFELANSGTLYLDDIDDVPLELQVKLLRVIENQEFERVGGEETIKVNVRVIASTKKDLKKLVKEGKFREDLFYRLNIYPIHLLPLRERKEDISILVEYFINEYSRPVKKSIEKKAMELLELYNWPGNVRELKHLMERLVLISGKDNIKIEHLPKEILTFTPEIEIELNGSSSLDEIMKDVEIKLIKEALTKSANVSQAAKLLKIPYSTLRTKMEKYKLD